MSKGLRPYKKFDASWRSYQLHEKEPKHKVTYDFTPELEDEVLSYGVFLKHRARRNMKKLRREYNRPQYDRGRNRSKHYSKTFRAKPA